MIIKIFLLLFVVSLPSFGQTLKPEPSPFLSNLAGKYSIDVDNIHFSFKRIDKPEDGFGHQEDKSAIPASLTKILTSYYSLSTLGDDYRFFTTLESNGKIENGILKGNLILRGSGDPFFTNAMLINMALTLKSKGIKEISGSFIYDDSSLPYIQMISEIGLGDQTYNPGVSALSLEFNRFSVWKGSSPIPHLNVLDIHTVSETFMPGLRFKLLDSSPKQEKWALSKKQRYGTHEELPIRNPALIFSHSFKMICKKVGIDLPVPVNKRVSGQKIIVQQKSKPLSALVKSTMEYSNNMMAELLMLGADKKLHQSSSLEDAAKKMKEWLKKEGSYLGALELKNGSGLDSKNRIKARALTQFLHDHFDKQFGSTTFPSLFSISGQSGWLLKRLREPEMAYNVWAKTGSLDYIDNMAGYLFTKSGKTYAFSIFINDFQKRKKLDEDNSKNAENLRREAKSFRARSNPFIDELLRHWFTIL